MERYLWSQLETWLHHVLTKGFLKGIPYTALCLSLFSFKTEPIVGLDSVMRSTERMYVAGLARSLAQQPYELGVLSYCPHAECFYYEVEPCSLKTTELKSSESES